MLDSSGAPCHTCGSRNRAVAITGISATASLGSFTASATGMVQPSLPSILLQATVQSIGATPDGDLVVAVGPAWNAIIAELVKDPSLAFKIGWREWEEIIAAGYETAGFDEVILTPRSGDLGRDVIATKRGLLTVRIVDQVKAHGPHNPVNANDVRALLGVLQADQKASKGVVTTTSTFAPEIAKDPLITPFIPTRLELINGDELRRRLAAIASGKKA
jgi:restriction system protein